MPDTMQSYAEVLDQKDRALFFGTVPNYVANLDIEIARIEAAHPAWVGSPAVEAIKNSWHAANKWGKKKGSSHQEV